MTEQSFNDWYEIFWQTYPKDLLHGKKGAKEGPFKEKLRGFKQEKRDDILFSLREQVRYYRKLKNAGEDKTKWCFPMVSVWVNQARWSEEIESHAELQEKIEAKSCKCGKPVHGPRFTECYECHAETIRRTPGTNGYETSQALKKRWSEHPHLQGMAGREMVKQFIKVSGEDDETGRSF